MSGAGAPVEAPRPPVPAGDGGAPRLNSVSIMHSRLGRLLLLAAVFGAAAAIATWPALRDAHDSYLGLPRPTEVGAQQAGDHLQLVWAFWLPGHQLGSGDWPLRDPYTFQPLASAGPNTQGWLFGPLFWPLDQLFGLVAAYNAIVLISFVLAAVFAWLWLRSLGLGQPAALVGAVAFELAPYRVAQSTGHLLGLASFLLPAMLLAIERRRPLAGALLLAAIPLSGQLHLALGAIPLYLAYAFLRMPERRDRLRAASGAALAGAAGILVYWTGVRGSAGDELGRSIDETRRYSASIGDFLHPSLDAGLERMVFLGRVLPVFGVIGVFVLVRAGQRKLAILLVTATMVPVVLAFGPNLPFGFYEGLRVIASPLASTRVPGRLLPIACLALAALAAFAVDALRRSRPMALLALVILVFDLHVTVFAALAADGENAAYRSIRPDRTEGALLELPIFRPDSHWGSIYLGYATQAPGDRLLGYSTTAPASVDRLARSLEGLSCGRGTIPGSVAFIAVHHALFAKDESLAAGCARRAEASLAHAGFKRRATDGPVTMWARTSPAVGRRD